MKISVILTTKNEEKWIKGCLDSLFSQSRVPDEVLLIDANSTDKTLEIASGYNIKIFSDPTPYGKGGLARSRTFGYQKAKGDIIVYTDVDGYFHKDWLKEIEKTFKDQKIVGVQGRIVLPEFRYLTERFNKENKKRGVIYTCGCNMAFRRNVMEPFDETIGWEDMDIGYRMSKKGEVVYNEKAIFYHFSTQSLKRNVRNGKNHIKWFRKYKDWKVFGRAIYYPISDMLNGNLVRGMENLIGTWTGMLLEVF